MMKSLGLDSAATVGVTMTLQRCRASESFQSRSCGAEPFGHPEYRFDLTLVFPSWKPNISVRSVHASPRLFSNSESSINLYSAINTAPHDVVYSPAIDSRSARSSASYRYEACHGHGHHPVRARQGYAAGPSLYVNSGPITALDILFQITLPTADCN